MMNETQIRELIGQCRKYSSYLQKVDERNGRRNVYGMRIDQATDAFNEMADVISVLEYLLNPIPNDEGDALVRKIDSLLDDDVPMPEIEKQIEAITDAQVAAILFSRMRKNIKTAERQLKAGQN